MIFLVLSALAPRAMATSGADFLKIPVSARPKSMSGAFAAVGEDASSSLYNPACLSGIKNPLTQFSHNLWVENIAIDYITAAYPTSHGVFGGFLKYLYLADKIDEMQLLGGSPYPTGGSVSASDIAFGISFARNLKGNIQSGINLKLISRKLADYSASAFALDAGILWRPIFAKGLNVGFSFRNLGTSIKFDAVSEKLPMEIRLGISRDFSFGFEHSILTAVDFAKLSNEEMKVNLGTEYSWKKFLFVRTGYKVAGSDTEGFSAGFGVKWEGFSFDYAYSPFEYLGNTQSFTFSYHFGQKDFHAKRIPRWRERRTQRRKTEKKIRKEKARKKLSPRTKKMLMKKHFKKATQLYQQGKYEEAISEWKKVLELDPNHELSRKKIEKAKEKLLQQQN